MTHRRFIKYLIFAVAYISISACNSANRALGNVGEIVGGTLEKAWIPNKAPEQNRVNIEDYKYNRRSVRRTPTAASTQDVSKKTSTKAPVEVTPSTPPVESNSPPELDAKDEEELSGSDRPEGF